MFALFLGGLTAMAAFAYIDNQEEGVRAAEVETLATERVYGVDVN